MTAVIYHGPPGSYKTFSVIQDVVVPELLKGRVVVTNIRGLDDIDRIEAALNVDIPDEAEIISVPHSREGFQQMARFFHWAPPGALVVMDEGQRVYPTRTKSLSEHDFPGGPDAAQVHSRPATVEDAFDQHRHHNWDIYITTTNIDKIHKEIRQVCEYGYRHRDLSGFLPWWKNRWRQVKHDPTNNGVSKSHEILFQRRKADVRYFAAYQSTATGVARDSAEGKAHLWKSPKFLGVCFVILAALVLNIRSWYQIATRDNSAAFKVDRQENPPNTVVSVDPDSGVVTTTVVHYPHESDTVAPVENDSLERITAKFRLEYLGQMTYQDDSRGFFRLIDQQTDRYAMISSTDLEGLGITVDYYGCLVELSDDLTSELAACANQEGQPPPDRSPETFYRPASRAILLEHDSSRTVKPLSESRGRGSNATSRATRAGDFSVVPGVNQPRF